MRPTKNNANQRVVVGDIVLIENEGKKKVLWPMGRVIQTYEGKDGNVRVVRLKTASGELVRPVQRIFPLEITADVDSTKNDHTNQPAPSSATPIRPEVEGKVFVTKSGRRVKLPSRFIE
ncbi:hypothetical protein JTE90_015944 [Oedothorax gibbosus]|uniref:DUF5641 domain-containing protein n=1 Tax=Oedothorax gibbosus TaxID=931172 RepID=A0AAV6TLD7_9ARAC|nr:hypothetical protein JTE90_015944 [Oedothorax gibbosus]